MITVWTHEKLQNTAAKTKNQNQANNKYKQAQCTFVFLFTFPLQFPMINEFGEDTNSYCSFESKETAMLHSENGSLQQRVNALTHEVNRQDNKKGKD